jgi:hypothetical protein
MSFISEKSKRVNAGVYDDGKYIYGFHTLYIEKNGCSPARVKEILDAVFDELAIMDGAPQGEKKDLSPERHKFRYSLNPINGKDRAYAYAMPVADYYRMIGLNANGTSRMVRKPVESVNVFPPATQPNQPPVPSSSGNLPMKAKKSFDFDWADDDCDFTRMVREKPVTPPPKPKEPEYIEVPGDHLIKTPGYVFIYDQDSDHWQDLVSKDQIAVMRARVSFIRDNLVPNMFDVFGFSNADLSRVKAHFKQYSTSKKQQYPEIQETRPVFRVTYDPDTHDAYFAYLVNNGATVRIGQDCQITCSYIDKKKRK